AAGDLDEALGEPLPGDPLQSQPADAPTGTQSLPEAVAQLEKRMIQAALTQAQGNRAEAARQLGIHRQLLYRKLDDYGLQ
ncbi:helix-turn-helix domain-containing protein, partial [Xanthomonas campestris]